MAAVSRIFFIEASTKFDGSAAAMQPPFASAPLLHEMCQTRLERCRTHFSPPAANPHARAASLSGMRRWIGGKSREDAVRNERLYASPQLQRCIYSGGYSSCYASVTSDERRRYSRKAVSRSLVIGVIR